VIHQNSRPRDNPCDKKQPQPRYAKILETPSKRSSNLAVQRSFSPFQKLHGLLQIRLGSPDAPRYSFFLSKIIQGFRGFERPL
jgi:hypothetical protein